MKLVASGHIISQQETVCVFVLEQSACVSVVSRPIITPDTKLGAFLGS